MRPPIPRQLYEPQAWERIQMLHEKLKAKRYRAHPLRRVYIEKEDGRETDLDPGSGR
jgi:retron-type reverse transcriptase